MTVPDGLPVTLPDGEMEDGERAGSPMWGARIHALCISYGLRNPMKDSRSAAVAHPPSPALPKAINDLSRGNEDIAHELVAAATRVVQSGWYVLGSEVAAFESEFAAYCGVSSCISVANGTDALELALRAVGAGPGAMVATVANAGAYSLSAIAAIGAHPLYVEIDGDSLLMDPVALESADLQYASAIVVTHLYGRMAQIEAIAAFASRKGIPLIEDCAQAHGAALASQKAGSFGSAGCFSFYPTKNLGALGDGGAVVTSDPKIASRVKMLRQYGWRSKYVAEVPGGRNSRLDEIQAAFLREKLPHLDKWNERRRAIALRYCERISHPLIRLPSAFDQTNVAHLFVIRSQHRDALLAHLKSRSVPADIHYPLPDYRQPSFGTRDVVSLPLTERSCATVLTLPCFPQMTDDEVDAVSGAVNAWSMGR